MYRITCISVYWTNKHILQKKVVLLPNLSYLQIMFEHVDYLDYHTKCG